MVEQALSEEEARVKEQDIDCLYRKYTARLYTGLDAYLTQEQRRKFIQVTYNSADDFVLQLAHFMASYEAWMGQKIACKAENAFGLALAQEAAGRLETMCEWYAPEYGDSRIVEFIDDQKRRTNARITRRLSHNTMWHVAYNQGEKDLFLSAANNHQGFVFLYQRNGRELCIPSAEDIVAVSSGVATHYQKDIRRSFHA